MLSNLSDRASAYSDIAEAAIKHHDSIRAAETISDAETQILREEDSMTRSWAPVTIQQAALDADSYLGIDVTREAIRAFNKIDSCSNQKTRCDPLHARRVLVAQSELRLGPALARLAEKDFDGAVLLAGSIADKEASLLAILSACRAVLPASPPEPAGQPLLPNRENLAQQLLLVH
jgi:hypothetical protein